MAWRVRTFVLLAGALLALCGCATATREPANLDVRKREIRRYVEDGSYRREIEDVARRADRWIAERTARGGPRLTVVFDLDETLLSNWPYLQAGDFGFVLPEWNRWVDEAKAPAIESVREVYRTALRSGIEVVFITGRAESVRTVTERNLRAIACSDYAALYCRPAGQTGTSADYKTAIRRKLVTEGRTIIANIGDQDSDLSGGFSERTFKLPNPFYLTE